VGHFISFPGRGGSFRRAPKDAACSTLGRSRNMRFALVLSSRDRPGLQTFQFLRGQGRYSIDHAFIQRLQDGEAVGGAIAQFCATFLAPLALMRLRGQFPPGRASGARKLEWAFSLDWPSSCCRSQQAGGRPLL